MKSFVVAGSVTLACMLLSIPLARIADRNGFFGKRFSLTALQIPLIRPPLVGALGLKRLLSRNDGINALLVHFNVLDQADTFDWLRYPMFPCIALEILFLHPMTLLNIYAALTQVDPSLEEAAVAAR